MSEDQVTHTPTPWVVLRDVFTGEPRNVVSGNPPYAYTILASFGAIAKQESSPATVDANAEFIVLAVNSYDALTARVAELEAENEGLRALVDKCRSQFNLLSKMATVKTIYVVVNGERVRKRKEDVISLECRVAVEKIDAALNQET